MTDNVVPRTFTDNYTSAASSGMGIVRAASDWSIVIISTLPNSLTGSRGRVF